MFNKEGKIEMTLINLQNVEKQFKYGDFKLSNINLNIKKGEIVGLVGENGSGKSTIINLIAGIKVNNSGNISFFENKQNYKDNLSFVLDDVNFPETMNVYQLNNCFKHIYTSWDSKQFFYYIKKFDIPQNKKTKHFSKGMKMKLSLSIALSHKSKLLILDEATSGLDLSSREIIMQEIKDYVLENDSGVLITSHIGHDIDYLAEKIYFIKKGKIISKIYKSKFYNSYSYLKLTNREFDHFHQKNYQYIYAYHQKQAYTEIILDNTIPNWETKENITNIDTIIKILLKGVVLK